MYLNWFLLIWIWRIMNGIEFVCVEMGWLGLYWIGLNWLALYQIGWSCIEIVWNERDELELDFIELHWIGIRLNVIEFRLNSIGLICTDFDLAWTELIKLNLTCVGLNCFELAWIGWIEMGWIGSKPLWFEFYSIDLSPIEFEVDWDWFELSLNDLVWLDRVRLTLIELTWIGLRWLELCWIGLQGLGYIGWDTINFDWIRLDSMEID